MTNYIKFDGDSPVGAPVGLGQGWKEKIEPDPMLAEQAARFRETAEAEKREAGYLKLTQVIVPDHDPATHTVRPLEDATFQKNQAGDGAIATLSLREKTTDEKNAPRLAQIEAAEKRLIRTLSEIAAGDGDVADAKTGKTPREFLAERKAAIAALRAQLE